MRHELLVAGYRGKLAETLHQGSVAVVDVRGQLIAHVGDAAGVNFTRSTLKPIQVIPLLEDGGMDYFDFTSHELALMCASHSGEPVHVRLVKRILTAAGASQSDLKCGCHPPAYLAAMQIHSASARRFSALHHNCSGKHAGFLALAKLRRQPFGSYLDCSARVQKRIRATVQRHAPGESLVAGIDGCGAPNYAMSLSRLAHIYGRLACGDTPELDAVRFAMTLHPDLVSGSGRADLALIRTGRGDWVAKGGAAGIQAIGVRSLGLGIAVRVADGTGLAAVSAAIEVLHQLGEIDAVAAEMLRPLWHPTVWSDRRQPVGQFRPVFKLRRR